MTRNPVYIVAATRYNDVGGWDRHEGEWEMRVGIGNRPVPERPEADKPKGTGNATSPGLVRKAPVRADLRRGALARGDEWRLARS